MLALTAGIFMFKDQILPNLNAGYKEQYAAYVKASAEVVSVRHEKHRRGSIRIIKVQFRDEEEQLHTVELEDRGLDTHDEGETVKVYYNPENPRFSAVSEDSYRNVMGK